MRIQHSRRSSIITDATQTESEALHKECDPDAENLCLYGNADGTWSVGLPAEMVPPELPEPTVGINFARDGMSSKNLWHALGTCARLH